MATVFCVVGASVSGFGQSLTVENKVTMTATKVERVMERLVHGPYGPQMEHPGKGAEFAKLSFAPRLLADQTGDPCSFESSVPLVRAGDYELVDSADGKVLGMVVTVAGSGPCKSFTVLFQPSPVGASFTKIRFKSAEADLSKVPGAKVTAGAKP